MSNAVNCSGCAATLAVPRGAAGKVLRCPRCATLNPIPAEPDYEPEPPARVRAERVRAERDDDDPPPRRKDRGVPRWAWGVGAGCVAVAAVVVAGLMLGRRAKDRDAEPVQPPREQLAEQGMLPEVWERRTDEATGATWEFPHTGQTTPTSAAVRFQDQRALGFEITVTDVRARRKSVPLYNPMSELRAARVGDANGFGRIERVGTLDGRPAVVARAQIYVVLAVADAERLYEFKVTFPERDEGEKRVKRFFDSARITKPLPAEPSPTVPGGGIPGVAADSGEAIPAGWDRVSVPRTKMTLLMPKGPPTHPGTTNGFQGSLPVARGMVNAAGGELNVSACYIEAKGVAPNVGDPFGGVKGNVAVTVGGYPARLHHREFGGSSFVHLIVELGEMKTIVVAMSGTRIDPAAPDVKRVLDSVSFTLPPKNGPGT